MTTRLPHMGLTNASLTHAYTPLVSLSSKVPVAAHSAPDRLYGEIGRLKMDLDWLKKKSGVSLP